MDAHRFDNLTPTQREVLRLAADHSNSEIAQVLGLSRETVKTHLARAKMRLDGMHRGAASRALRELEVTRATTAPGVPPSEVNPTRGIARDAPDEALPMQASGKDSPDPDAHSVCEPRAFYDVGCSMEPAPATQTRFHAQTLGDRLQCMATATLKLSIAILVMLSVAEGIQRIVVSNPGVIPSR